MLPIKENNVKLDKIKLKNFCLKYSKEREEQATESVFTEQTYEGLLAGSSQEHLHN